MGGQSKYTPELADAIVEWIAEGKTLREFCRQDGMPSHMSVYRWMEADKDFAFRFAHARVEGEELIGQECLAIADTPLEGVETKVDGNGTVIEMKRSDMLGHRKLQIETRLKLLAKWNPKKWGDKVDLNHSGKVDGGVLVVPVPADSATWESLAAAQQSALIGKTGDGAENS